MARSHLERAADGYNQSLSELRARVKNFLVSQGITPEKIVSAAYGKQKQLDKAMVSDLQTRNPNPLPQTWARDSPTTWPAYNRRVDLVLIPSNAESERFYPNQTADSGILGKDPSQPESRSKGTTN